jgi:hypothetical protein
LTEHDAGVEYWTVHRRVIKLPPLFETTYRKRNLPVNRYTPPRTLSPIVWVIFPISPADEAWRSQVEVQQLG